ncbi:hypothetical protein [Kordia antarctica]|nr:hypothetical protein [Kordia antarctica]
MPSILRQNISTQFINQEKYFFEVSVFSTFFEYQFLETNTLNYILMKKSLKKMQLKKHSISVLNADAAKGGLIPTTSFASVLCKSAIYIGEDLCFTDQQQR